MPSCLVHLVLATAILISGALAETAQFIPRCSEQARCGDGDLCCADAIRGDVCYNPETHRCMPSRFECPLGRRAEICGLDLCFNSETQQCYNQLVLCGTNDWACGQICYNPDTHVCFPGNVLCAKGDLPCGPTCYDPSRYICTEFGELLLRDPAAGQCGGQECVAEEACCVSRTGGFADCFDFQTEHCCGVSNPGLMGLFSTVCGVDEDTGLAARCCATPSGTVCYDPLVSYCCNTRGSLDPVCPLSETVSCCGPQPPPPSDGC